MVAVDEFVQSKSGTEEPEREPELKCVKRKSRKELRKETRKMKKARMKSHYEGNKTLSLPADDEDISDEKQPPVQEKEKKPEKSE